MFEVGGGATAEASTEVQWLKKRVDNSGDVSSLFLYQTLFRRTGGATGSYMILHDTPKPRGAALLYW